MAVWIVTDSASDIPVENDWGVMVIPMMVSFGDQTYQDGLTLHKEDFYQKLTTEKELPKTSMVTPGEFEAIFRKIPTGDTAVVILLSSKLSGCCDSAMLVAERFENIYVVDSLNASAGEQILVQYALNLRDKGLSAPEIVACLEEKKSRIQFVALLDTLEYLRRGGRISAGTAILGTMLNIKPIIAVKEGSVALLDKARGFKKGSKLIAHFIQSCGGINLNLPFDLVYSGLSDAIIRQYAATYPELWAEKAQSLTYTLLGSVIGTHIGPDAIGVAFFAKE